MQSGRYILVCRSDFQFDDVRQSELFQSTKGRDACLERYSHVRMEAKRKALEVLTASTKTACYDTNQPAVTTRPV
jgi:hypothetical protein